MANNSVMSLVASDLELVNKEILSQLGSRVPLVEQIAEYIVDSGGKRIRPILAVLVAGALDKKSDKTYTLAAIIEYLHTATLLHDDVVDDSSMRRGRQTANLKWGNSPSILVGDFLYSRAFQMMVQLDSMAVMKILGEATNKIAEGEVWQLMNARNPEVDEATYMEVIKAKTAELFSAATASSAALAGANSEQEAAFYQYGIHLGLAFQLIDDVLDYEGDAETLGKNVGDDLAEGKPTLPLIHAMQTGSSEQADTIRQAIEEGDLEALPNVLAAVNATGAIEYARQQAEKQADLAIACIAGLADSECKTALNTLAHMAVRRDS